MFENPAKYPELVTLQSHWKQFRDEVMPILFAAREMKDERSNPGEWYVLPLMVEPEDHGVFFDTTISLASGYVPKLCAVVDQVPFLRAYALSVVHPGGKIKAHVHHNPYASASICLSGGQGSFIDVSGEKHLFEDGSMAIFDYRRCHQVVNGGIEPRVALIVAVDLK